MRKFENVDVTAALGAVMEINTEHYKSDFRYDKEMFLNAATNPDAENTRLLWLSRPSGTECFKERNAYLKGNYANHAWSYYAGTRDTILAYAVEITGMENGKVKGNLYELDYKRHVEQLTRDALPTVSVKLKFEDGTERQYSYADYDRQWYGLQMKYGKITESRFEPENEDALRGLLKRAHDERQKYTPAVFKVRIHSKKPSIRAQLAEGRAAAATPKRAAARTKSNELEV